MRYHNIIPENSVFLADGTLADQSVFHHELKEKIIRDKIEKVINAKDDDGMETMVLNNQHQLICKKCVIANKNCFIGAYAMDIESCWSIKHIIRIKNGGSDHCFNG